MFLLEVIVKHSEVTMSSKFHTRVLRIETKTKNKETGS